MHKTSKSLVADNPVSAHLVNPEGKISVLECHNLFHLEDRKISHVDLEKGDKLSKFIPVTRDHESLMVGVSGKIVDSEDWDAYEIQSYDTVTIVYLPSGDAKDIVRVVAIAIIAAAATAFLGPGAGMWAGLSAGKASFFGTLAVIGATAGGAMLVHGLLPPESGDSGNMDDGNTYGIDGAKLTSSEGIPVPVPYGQFRMAGNIIGLYTQNAGNDQFLHMLINAGEGPISGITDIEINEQPIDQFSDVEYKVRLGTVDQSVIPWFRDNVVPEAAAGSGSVVLDHVTWATHTTDVSRDIDRFTLDFVCPTGLIKINNDGKRKSVDLELEIQYRVVGAGTWDTLYNYNAVTLSGPTYVYNGYNTYDNEGQPSSYNPEVERDTLLPGDTVTNDVVYDTNGNRIGYVRNDPEYSGPTTINGKQSAALRFTFQSPTLPTGQYEIRVRRANEDRTSNGGNDTFFEECQWNTVNEIVDDDVAYRNTALLALRIRVTDQLSSVPNVTFLNNGRVIRSFVNGNWVDSPSNNPAWVALDMYTDTRFGGGIPLTKFDIEKYKEWAEYCDTKGLTFNGVFDSAMDFPEAIKHVFRAGHAREFSTGTKRGVVVEKAETPIMMFNSSNILEGSFSQNWTSINDRANEIECIYYDETDRYKERRVKVYDSTVPSGTEPNSASIRVFGVTTYDRAFEEAVFQLKRNKYIRSTIQFDSTIEGLPVTQGDVVVVQHEQPDWSVGGRMASGSFTSVLKLDRDVTLEPATTYKVLVKLDSADITSGTVNSVSQNYLNLTNYSGEAVDRITVNGTDYAVERYDSNGVWVPDATGIVASDSYTSHDTDVILERTVTNSAGTTDTLNISAVLPSAPPKNAIWVLGETSVVNSLWRVSSVERASDYTTRVSCSEYNEEIYDWTSGVGIAPPIDSGKSIVVPHVTNVEAKENNILIGGVLRPQVDVSWIPPADFPEYAGAEIWVSINGEGFKYKGQSDPSTDLFTFEVSEAIDYDGDGLDSDGDPIGDEVAVQVVTLSLDGRKALRSTAPTASLGVAGDNGAPDDPTAVTISASTSGINVHWTNPQAADLAGIEVWRHTSTLALGAVESTATLIDVVTRGTTRYHDATITTVGQDYYYWVRATDFTSNKSNFVVPTPAYLQVSTLGADPVTGYLTNESITLPADSAGTVSDFSEATGEFKVYEGTTDETSNSTFSTVSSTSCTVQINTTLNEFFTGPKGAYRVTAMTADTAAARFSATFGGVTIVRDLSLSKSRAGTDGSGANASILKLTASRQTVAYDKDDNIQFNQDVTFTTLRENLSNSVTWTVYDPSDTLVTPSPLTLTSDTGATLTGANFDAEGFLHLRVRASITENSKTYIDEITIVKIKDGADGINGDNGLSIAELYIYRRDSGTPTQPSGGSYNFDTKTLTPPTGWTAAPQTGTDPVWICAATASISGVSGTDSSLTWSAPQKGFEDGAEGSSVDIIFRRSADQPATPGNSAGVPNGWFSDVASVTGTTTLWSSVGTRPDSSTNWTWNVPVQVEGDEGPPGLSVAEVYVYVRDSGTPATPSGGTYNFDTKTLAVVPSGWFAAIPSGTDPVWISITAASIQGTSGSDSSLTWSTPVKSWENGADGQTGASVDVIFKRNATRPNTPAPSASTPSTWFSDVDQVTGTAILWSSVGRKDVGATNYVWQLPVQVEGTDGDAGPAGLSVAEVSIFRRSSGSLGTPTGGEYNFTTKVLTPPLNWNAQVPTGTNPLYTCRAVASIQGTTGIDNTLTWSAPSKLAEDGAPGDDGLEGTSVDVIFRRSLTQPDTPSPSSGVPSLWSSDVNSTTGTNTLWSSFGTRPDSLTNWTWQTPVQVEGQDGATGLSVAEVYLYRRNATSPSAPTGGEYDFSIPGLSVVPANWKTDIGQLTGTNPVWVSTTVASAAGANGVDTTLTWTAPQKVYSDGADGAAGAEGTSVDVIFRRSADQPTTPGPSSGVPANWYSSVDSVPAGSNPIWSSFGTRPDSLSNWTWQEPVKVEGQDGTNGTNGDDGWSIAEVYAYRRNANTPPTPTDGSYNFDTQTLTAPANWEVSPDQLSSWGANPIWVTVGQAKIIGQSGTDSSLNWSTPVKALNEGASVDMVFRRSLNQPSTPLDSATSPPTDWYSDVDSVPNGSNPIWSSVGTRVHSGTDWVWNVPIQQEGTEGAPGGAGADGLSVAELYIYRRNSTKPSTPVGGEYNFTTQTLTSPSTSWKTDISDLSATGTAPVWISTGTASIVGSTGIDSDITWTEPFKAFQDGEGVDIIFRRSADQPDTPAPSSGTPVNWFSDVNSVTGTATLWSSIGQRSSPNANWLWDTPVQVEGQDGESLSVAEISIFRRTSGTPSTPTGGTYSFDNTTLTVVPANWNNTIPSGTNPVWVSTTVASITGISGSDSSLTWSSPVKVFSDGAEGTEGTSVNLIFKRWATQPQTPSPTSGIPSTWFDNVANVTGTDKLWASVGTRVDSSSNWIWQVPYPVEGDEGPAGPEGPEGPPGEDAGGGFFDAFEYAGDTEFRDVWFMSQGNNFDISFPGGGLTGDGLLVVNDYIWATADSKMFEFDPSALYRISCRYRKSVEDTSGDDQVYVGIQGFDANKNPINNTGGSGRAVSTAAVSSKSPTVGSGWQEASTYFMGTLVTGNSGEFPDRANPGSLHNDVRYIAPIVIANHVAGSATYEFDYVRIELLDRDVGEGLTDQTETATNSNVNSRLIVGPIEMDGSKGARITASGYGTWTVNGANDNPVNYSVQISRRTNGGSWVVINTINCEDDFELAEYASAFNLEVVDASGWKSFATFKMNGYLTPSGPNYTGSVEFGIFWSETPTGGTGEGQTLTVEYIG